MMFVPFRMKDEFWEEMAARLAEPIEVISPTEAIQTLDAEGVLDSSSMNAKFKTYPLTFVIDRIPGALICFSPGRDSSYNAVSQKNKIFRIDELVTGSEKVLDNIVYFPLNLEHAEIFAKSRRTGLGPSDYFSGLVVHLGIYSPSPDVLHLKSMQYCFKSEDSLDIARIAWDYCTKFKQARQDQHTGANQDLIEATITCLDKTSITAKGDFLQKLEEGSQNLLAYSFARKNLGFQ